jgi:hypothetical protein
VDRQGVKQRNIAGKYQRNNHTIKKIFYKQQAKLTEQDWERKIIKILKQSGQSLRIGDWTIHR